MKTLPVFTPIAHRDHAVLLHDRAQRPEHPLLVVAGARRRPGCQERLDARLSDIGLVERHLELEGGFLDLADPLVEADGERLGADLREQLVRIHHVDERGGDRPMLGLALLEEDVAAGRDRNARGDVDPADVAHVRRPAPAHFRRSGQEDRRVLRRTHAVRREHRGDQGRDPDLAGIRDRLHRQRLGHGRPRDEQLAMDAAGHEEVERSRADPDRHSKDERAAGQVEAPDPVDRPLHLPCSAARAKLVLGTVKEEKERVAAPLQEACTPVVGLVEQGPEHPVQRVPHELGADLASCAPAAR